MINSWTFSTPIRRVAAHNSRACRNWTHLSFLAPRSTDRMKIRSSCVLVSFRSTNPLSAQSFAKFLAERPTPAFVPPNTLYSSKRSRRARAAPVVLYGLGLLAPKEAIPGVRQPGRRRGEPCGRAEAARSAAR